MSRRLCEAEHPEADPALRLEKAVPLGESGDPPESIVGPEATPNEPGAAPSAPGAAPSLLWHARWTVPLHLVLPVGLWWLIRNDPIVAASVFAGVNVGVPVLLLITVRWWWGRVVDLVLLLLINHLATFSVLAFLPW